ncbi:hypothetical protein V6N13_108467 [Hibiscus sabdariffa]
MVETRTVVVVNPDATKEAEETSKGWEEHRAELEDRLTNIETKLDETTSKLETNNSLLAKLLGMLTEKEEEKSPATMKKNANKINNDSAAKSEGKRPIQQQSFG